jgi:hypothetical protein
MEQGFRSDLFLAKDAAYTTSSMAQWLIGLSQHQSVLMTYQPLSALVKLRGALSQCYGPAPDLPNPS